MIPWHGNTFSSLWALCPQALHEENPLVNGSPHKGPEMQRFNVFCYWSEKAIEWPVIWDSLMLVWRHCNDLYPIDNFILPVLWSDSDVNDSPCIIVAAQQTVTLCMTEKITSLTKWSLGEPNVILKMLFLSLFYWCVSSDLMMMPSEECQRTLLMIS